MTVISEHWQIHKPEVSGDKGLVASQHYIASDVGAEVLRQGGNAIDAAIAAGLTLGTVEPWMSGIGGGGYMTIYLADTREVKVVEFGMRAPLDAIPEDYPLAGGGENSTDGFNWPMVIGDTNIQGPMSVAVPGYIQGISKALGEFGSWHWQDIIEPACRQAELGVPIDWYSAQKINQWARNLRAFDETRRVYLADGLPPIAATDGSLGRLQLGNLAQTYRHLQNEGPDSFYSGALADSIVHDLQDAGSRIKGDDLTVYKASINSPLTTSYRGSTLYTAGNLTAGPSIIHALKHLEANQRDMGKLPNSDTYSSYADALFSAYAHRLTSLGEGPDTRTPGSTSHLCVADVAGNVVSLTQTIMSPFGSRVMLPQSGILMNNGMMWFDPRPGGPNSVLGGRRPLCNMCPVILATPDGAHTAIGACGGRKIFPAVFQLASFLSDYTMSVTQAAHQPRLDVSGTDQVTVMAHMDDRYITRLRSRFSNLAVRPNGVNPNLFALPQLIRREASGMAAGGCFVPSPHAKVSAVR